MGVRGLAGVLCGLMTVAPCWADPAERQRQSFLTGRVNPGVAARGSMEGFMVRVVCIVVGGKRISVLADNRGTVAGAQRSLFIESLSKSLEGQETPRYYQPGTMFLLEGAAVEGPDGGWSVPFRGSEFSVLDANWMASLERMGWTSEERVRVAQSWMMAFVFPSVRRMGEALFVKAVYPNPPAGFDEDGFLVETDWRNACWARDKQDDALAKAFVSECYHRAFQLYFTRKDMKMAAYLGRIEKEFFKNPQDAAVWFERARQNGSAEGARELGLMYRDGIGVKKDLRQAYLFLDEASSKKDPQGMAAFAGLLRAGVLEFGITADPRRAIELLRSAIVLGETNSTGHGDVLQKWKNILSEWSGKEP